MYVAILKQYCIHGYDVLSDNAASMYVIVRFHFFCLTIVPCSYIFNTVIINNDYIRYNIILLYPIPICSLTCMYVCIVYECYHYIRL